MLPSMRLHLKQQKRREKRKRFSSGRPVNDDLSETERRGTNGQAEEEEKRQQPRPLLRPCRLPIRPEYNDKGPAPATEADEE